MTPGGKTWHVVDVSAAPEAREAVEYGLMEAGALGTETSDSGDQVRITAYHEQPIAEGAIRAALLDALRIYSLSSKTLIDLRVREVADRVSGGADPIPRFNEAWFHP